MDKRLLLNAESILVIGFSMSLALGTLNPFYLGTTEEGGFGLCHLFTLLLIPSLYIKYGHKALNSLIFNGWQRPIVVFWFIAFISSFVQADSVAIELFVYWGKILLDIALCILLPVSFKNRDLFNLSMLAYSISCVILSVAVLGGFLGDFVTVHNGRMWLWGENPNSSSCRWAMAILFILYLTLTNPFKWKRLRLALIVGVLPLLLLVFMSGSRGSLILAIICPLLYLIKYSKANPVKLLFWVSVIAFPLIYLLPGILSEGDFAIFERLQESIDEGGNVTREQLLKSALDIFKHNPLFGVGSTNFMDIMTTVYRQEYTVHNLYAYILAISGLSGFVPFFIFIFRLFKGCWRLRIVNMFPLILLLFILLLAYKTGGILGYLLMWYIFSLIISFINIEYTHIKK